MTIRFKHGKIRFALWCPMCFVGIAVKSIIRHESEKNGTREIFIDKADKKAIRKIVNCVKTAKKSFGKLELVSVKSADGTQVKITL